MGFPAPAGLTGKRFAATGTDAISVGVVGDTNDRFIIDADGALHWGPGSGATDTTLRRLSADFLETLDKFRVTKTDSGAFRVATDGGTAYFTVDTIGALIKLASGVDFDFAGAGAAGCIIGQAADKLAFYGKAPVAQQAAISPPSGGAIIDVQARSAINDIITAIGTVGIII